MANFFNKIAGTIWRVFRLSSSLAASRGRGRRMGGAPGICGLSALPWEGSGGRLSADGTGHSHSRPPHFDTRDGRRLCCRRKRRRHALRSNFRSGLGSCSSRLQSARVCCGIFVSVRSHLYFLYSVHAHVDLFFWILML
jgi:hypothetical protein